MKYQILAGTLALVLLLGMSPLPNAEAKVFKIDDFSQDPMAPTVMCADQRTNLGSNGDLPHQLCPLMQLSWVFLVVIVYVI